eukprot:SAG25_NODE_4075_length_896_cov_1.179423_1_plen_55_part_10
MRDEVKTAPLPAPPSGVTYNVSDTTRATLVVLVWRYKSMRKNYEPVRSMTVLGSA